jgi:hypothetical protein
VTDWKRTARVIDPDCLPLYREVLDCGYPSPGKVTRHHVVPRGQGGDDVPENLVWATGDGTSGVHGVLETRCRDGETGITYPQAALALVEFVEARPEILDYTVRRKYDGWLRDRYLGFVGFKSPLERAEYLRALGRDEEAALIEANA